MNFSKKAVSFLVLLSFFMGVFPINAEADYIYEDFRYNILDDGTVEIADYTGSASELVIPSEIDGMKVASIGSRAFEGCTSLSSVTIPDSVTSIGYYSFWRCYYLEEVTLYEGITYIGKWSFIDCYSLNNLTIPNSVTYIGEMAFGDCDSFTEIVIPDSVKYLGAAVLSSCDNLMSVSIPDSVTCIENAPFEWCLNLASITVNSDNPNYVCENGILYSRDKKELICFPAKMPLASYCIPEGVTKICDNAFNYCEELVEIFIPDSVETIGNNAFWDCDGLTNISIPDSVVSIGESAFKSCDVLESIAIGKNTISIGDAAFDYCDDLKDVFYVGSEAEWNNISIGEANDYLISAAIHYNYVSPETQINNFVERLYTKLLGRASDANGKAKWVEKLKNGSTAADIAVNFVLSDELEQQKLSNETFVTRMYQTMLDRTPADSEVANWASYLDAGCTYAFVFRGFLSAPEFAKLCASYGIETGTYAATENRDVNGKLTKFISRLYTKALNRTYDVSGLNHHTGNYISGKYTLDKIASGFIFSAEFEKRNLSDANFVECMYNTFFDRASDASGKAKWLEKMSNGMTREEVFNGFVISAEYKALVKSFGL